MPSASGQPTLGVICGGRWGRVKRVRRGQNHLLGAPPDQPPQRPCRTRARRRHCGAPESDAPRRLAPCSALCPGAGARSGWEQRTSPGAVYRRRSRAGPHPAVSTGQWRAIPGPGIGGSLSVGASPRECSIRAQLQVPGSFTRRPWATTWATRSWRTTSTVCSTSVGGSSATYMNLGRRWRMQATSPRRWARCAFLQQFSRHAPAEIETIWKAGASNATRSPNSSSQGPHCAIRGIQTEPAATGAPSGTQRRIRQLSRGRGGTSSRRQPEYWGG